MYNPISLLRDLVAPRRCGGCSRAGYALCPACADDLMAVPLPATAAGSTSAIAAAWAFDGRVRTMLHRAKYRDGRSLLSALGDLAVERLPQPRPDEALVPVPLGRRRQRERGYNQAEIVAGRLASGWRRPVLGGLARPRETAPQVGTDAAVRRANVAGCFEWKGTAPIGRSLVLVDDVVTTGATTEAATEVLRAAGATDVRVVALALVR